MKLTEALNQIFHQTDIELDVLDYKQENCVVKLGEHRVREMSLEKVFDIANRKFAKKISASSQIRTALFSSQSKERFLIDIDPSRKGPEEVLYKDGEEWLLARFVDITQLADNASSDCRRPMAVGFVSQNSTFLTWSGPDMKPQVARCDNSNLSCEVQDLGPIKIHGKYYDFHDYTQMIQSADGHLNIFYSNHNQQLWQLRSPNADAIEGEWTKQEIKGAAGKWTNATYPMPVKSNDGSIFVFYRKTTAISDYRPIEYVKSTDNGLTWSEPKPAIDSLNLRSDHLNEVYIGRIVHDEKTDRILMSWTLAGGGPNHHAHDIYHKDIFFAYFEPATNRFYSVSGTDLGPFIEDEEAQQHCFVYDSGSLNQSVKQQVDYKPLVQFDPHVGLPLILLRDEIKEKSFLAKWNGVSWQQMEVPFKAREFAITPEGNLRIFVSQGTKLRVYESVDNGTSWNKIHEIETPENLDRMISVTGESNLLFGQHTTKEDDSSDAASGHSPVYLIKTDGHID